MLANKVKIVLSGPQGTNTYFETVYPNCSIALIQISQILGVYQNYSISTYTAVLLIAL